ncbi:MAG: hypothetical protein P4M09_17300 [Devosia sp.]|nr:hypothetical protein [Devosia sp.]
MTKLRQALAVIVPPTIFFAQATTCWAQSSAPIGEVSQAEVHLADYTLFLTVATFSLAIVTFLLALFAFASAAYFAKKERAFVFVKTTDVEQEHGISGGVPVVRSHRFAVVWANVGSTPTKMLHYRVMSRVTDGPLAADFAFDNDASEPDLMAVIGPKGTLTCPEIGVSDEDLGAVRHGSKHLYLWGWAEYYDTFWFTKRRRTEFCFDVGMNSDGNRLGMVVYSAHNGADDECAGRIHTYPPKHPHSWWYKLYKRMSGIRSLPVGK